MFQEYRTAVIDENTPTKVKEGGKVSNCGVSLISTRPASSQIWIVIGALSAGSLDAKIVFVHNSQYHEPTCKQSHNDSLTSLQSTHDRRAGRESHERRLSQPWSGEIVTTAIPFIAMKCSICIQDVWEGLMSTQTSIKATLTLIVVAAIQMTIWLKIPNLCSRSCSCRYQCYWNGLFDCYCWKITWFGDYRRKPSYSQQCSRIKGSSQLRYTRFWQGNNQNPSNSFINLPFLLLLNNRVYHYIRIGMVVLLMYAMWYSILWKLRNVCLSFSIVCFGWWWKRNSFQLAKNRRRN